MFRPWVFPGTKDAATGRRYASGEVYGLYQEWVVAQMRASPHWAAAGLDEKISIVVGGRRGQTFGADAAAQSPATDILAIAGYIGGWEEAADAADDSPENFFAMLNHVSETALPEARRLRNEAAAIAEARGRPLSLATYEAGPGYAKSGLNGARLSAADVVRQERVRKSVAAATATLDSFLARAALGFDLQNFFAFDEGHYWTSHATWIEGGHAHPPWTLLSHFNRVARGDMLAVEHKSGPRTRLASTGDAAEPADAPTVALYATRDGDRMALVAISRRVPGFPDPSSNGETKVVVDLPISSAATITRSRFDGAFDAHSADGRTVNFTSERLNPDRIKGGTLTIPSLEPGHAEIYVLDGVVSR